MTPPQNTPKAHPLLRLIPYTRHYYLQISIATLCSILNKIFDLAPPFLIGIAVDVVISQQNSFLGRFGYQDLSTQLWLLAALTIIIWSLESLFQYGYNLLWRNLAQSIEHEFRVTTYNHVQQLDMAYFEEQSIGNLLSILNDDINQLERFLHFCVNQLLQIATTIIVIGGLFIWLVPSVAWMTLLPIPVIIWGVLRFQTLLAPHYALVRKQVGLLNGQLANNLNGIVTIKSFTTEQHETARISASSAAYCQHNRQAIKLSSTFIPSIRMVIAVGFTAILVYGGQLAINGALNIGIYSMLVFMAQELLWPLADLGEVLDLYQRAMASTKRVLDLLDTQPQIIDGDKALPLAKVRGEISFSNVTFEYNRQIQQDLIEPINLDENNGFRPATIHNLSLFIPAGETAAIVGPTGAGKTTIVKLLLRLYDVQTGRITLDGQDVRDLQTADLRRAIGFVSQDVFLFHGTVRDNIAYGNLVATLEEIMEAAKTAEAHEFIMGLPQQYETIVGERGQKLSGGQRQRLSIARAILKNPPVLILDEATSAVDNETEAAIQRSLERIAVGRTTIVIAHRLSTVRNAHRIFVLDKGILKEQGQHDALIAAGGIYAGLWRVQTGQQIQ